MPDEPTLHSIDKKIVEICTNQNHMGKQLDSVVKAITDHVEQAERRMRFLEGCQESNAVRLKDNDDEIEKLRTKSDRWDSINSFLTFIAGVMPWLKP